MLSTLVACGGGGGGRAGSPFSGASVCRACYARLLSRDATDGRSAVECRYGVPVGPAVRTSVYTWYRNYTRANVEIDVQGNVGMVFLLP